MRRVVRLAEETPVIEPKIEEFSINGTLSGNLQDVNERLSKLPIFELKLNQDNVSIVRVESRDLQKRPFIFMLFEIKKDSIAIQYTVAPDTSDKIRRLNVISTLFNILSLIADIYTVDSREIFQYADSAIDNVLNSITQSYSTLFNKYDSMFNEYRSMKRVNLELAAANRTLTVQASQLNKDNELLKGRLEQLEKYSDEALMAMLQEWIESHDSTIDIDEFAKLYKLTPTRIEQVLNKMVSLGYIEMKG